MKNTAILFALLLMASVVSADIQDFPTEVRFHELPVELSFKATNTTHQPADVSVDVQVVPFTVISEPQTLYPGQTGEIKLRLVPRSDLLGSTYQPTVTPTLGDEATRKDTLIVFAPAEAGDFAHAAPALALAPDFGSVRPLEDEVGPSGGAEANVLPFDADR